MKKQDKINFIQDKTLKRVTILHTGGTISSKVDYETGAVSSKFKPEEIITMFPELKRIVNLDSRLISNMFSDDMNFSHYNILAKEIIKEIKKGVNGIIITHGTYTMADSARYTKSHLKRKDQTVIFTGSFVPMDGFTFSDAPFNLGFSIAKIDQLPVGEVYVCIGGRVLLADEATKIISKGKFVSLLQS